VIWDYGNTSSFISPISYEPGNLSRVHGFLYGSNTTIYANLDGGGVSILNGRNTGTNFQTSLFMGVETGGVRSVWVKDPTGRLIVNNTLTPDTFPPAPSGYYGFYTLTFPTSANGTYQLGVTNSWGVNKVFQTYGNTVHSPPPPDEEFFLMTFFGFLVVGFYFLGKIAKLRKSRTST
jgi:hypothetical protein